MESLCVQPRAHQPKLRLGQSLSVLRAATSMNLCHLMHKSSTSANIPGAPGAAQERSKRCRADHGALDMTILADQKIPHSLGRWQSLMQLAQFACITIG